MARTPSTARRPGTRHRPAPGAEVPVVGPREPCPCGSGKRYKLCHGRAARAAAGAVELRPYRGLAAEADWVALHEIVPAATATARAREGALGAGSPDVVVASILPGAQRAQRRADGTLAVGLQGAAAGDASAAAAAALLVVADGGGPGGGPGGRGPGGAASAAGAPVRLQDLLDPGAPFTVTVHEDFSYWLDGAETGEGDEAVRQAVAAAGESVVPTARLTSVDAAYWAQVGVRRHLRWVLPEDEQVLLDALARLHVAGTLTVGTGSRYLGAFRAQGLLVPVWDLDPDARAEDLEEPAAALRTALDEALATTGPLTDAQRRARAGVVARQVTLR